MNRTLIFILLTLSIHSYAQDEKSNEILQQLSINTQAYKNIDVDFNFKFENVTQEISENQKGNIKIDSNKFRLELNQQIIISDDTTQWIYLKESNELQIMEYDSLDDMISPNKLFTIYEEGYKNSYVELKNESGITLHIIDLFPIESNAFQKIQLQINSEKIQLHNIILFDKNGGSFTYLITKFSTDNNLDDNLFKFNPAEYPEIEIIDLR
ncbi:MAG: LolA family protein [Flavobacteriales bacterium]